MKSICIVALPCAVGLIDAKFDGISVNASAAP
jgi:hypothetical protein